MASSPRGRFVAVLAAVVVLVLGLGAGTAYAYWTSSGSGSGTATTGTLTGVSLKAVTASDSPGSLLIPGTGTPSNPGPGIASIVLKIENDNAFQVTLTSFTPSGTITVQGGSGCTSSNAAVTFLTKTGLSVAVPSGTTDVVVPLAVEMGTSSSNGCQGAYFSTNGSIGVQR